MKRCVWLLAALCALTLARAETPAIPETVIVPFDPKLPPAAQTPDRVYVPYERFLELWEAARAARTPAPKDPPPPVDQTITSARYDAQLGEHVLSIDATLDLLTGAPWTKVPLDFGPATLSALQLDAAPAALMEGAILVEKPGRHRITVHLEVPRPKGNTPLTLAGPATAAATLVLTLPDAQTTATLSCAGSVEQVVNGKRVLTAMGPFTELQIQPHTVAPPAVSATPAHAIIEEKVFLSAKDEEVLARVGFEFPGAEQSHFTLNLAPDVMLTSFEADNVRSWHMHPEENRQVLDLELSQPAKEKYVVTLRTRRTAQILGRELTVPALGTTAKRTELHEAVVESEPGLAVELRPGTGLRQTAANDNVGHKEGYEHVGAYAGDGALTYRVGPRAPRRVARRQYLYQVGRRQVDLFASLELQAKGDAFFAETIGLPAGYTIESVQTSRPGTWWREGDNLQLRFEKETPETTSLVLYLVRRETSAPASLAIRPLRLAGYRKITGEAALAAHQGVDVSWQLDGSATEMKPDAAAAQFQVIAPLERKRAFRFLAQDFTGEVKLQALPPRLNALWAMHAEAHESWVALRGMFRLSLRQGSIDRARFSLPATLPEARITGAELREARSKIEGDRRVYEVDLQNDVSGEVELGFELELPHTGKAALPAPLFPEAERTSGFLAIENASEGELQIEVHGLDPANPSELPWELARPGVARLYRTGGAEWSATLSIERLEKAEGRVAFCAWADLSTALRRDGMEWHKAVWHMQNRALQFLPVRLPQGAELVSVRVAGQSVRADAEEREGAKITLIPLIKTKPGELSYDVEAVYRIATAQPEGKQRHTLHDPELVGITVERTFWHVWLPEGFQLDRAEGNMEAVLSDVTEADKLEQNLQELQDIGKVARADDASEGTRAAARDNFERLKKEISASNGSMGFASRARSGPPSTPNLTSAAASHQNAYVEQKQAEVVRVLQEEGEKAKKMAAPAKPDANAKVAGNGRAAPWLTKSGTGTLTISSATQPAAGKPGGQLFLNDNVTWSGATTMSGLNGGMLSTNGGANSNAVLNTARGNIVAQQTQPHDSPVFMRGQAGVPGRAQMEKRAGVTLATGDLGGPQSEVANEDATRGGRWFASPVPPAASPIIEDSQIPNANPAMSPNTIGSLTVNPATVPGLAAAPPPPVDLAGNAYNNLDELRFQTGTSGAFPAAKPVVTGSLRTHLAPPVPVDHRVTIAVDFPTEGQPLHFKKVKGAAHLEVSLHETDPVHRWTHALILALAAGVLLVLQRLTAPAPSRAT